MKECYIRTHRPDLVDLYSSRIESMEGELEHKKSEMRTKLDEYKTRLVASSAEEEYSVNLERVTYRTIELRHYLKKCQDELKVKLS